eukprot:2794041-Prymnesium_polylepis.1
MVAARLDSARGGGRVLPLARHAARSGSRARPAGQRGAQCRLRAAMAATWDVGGAGAGTGNGSVPCGRLLDVQCARGASLPRVGWARDAPPHGRAQRSGRDGVGRDGAGAAASASLDCACGDLLARIRGRRHVGAGGARAKHVVTGGQSQRWPSHFSKKKL